MTLVGAGRDQREAVLRVDDAGEMGLDARRGQMDGGLAAIEREVELPVPSGGHPDEVGAAQLEDEVSHP